MLRKYTVKSLRILRLTNQLMTVTDLWKKNIGVGVADRQEGGGAAGTNM